MNKKEFEQFESIKYWMNSLQGKDGTGSTKYQWKLRLRKFCEWLGKTPDQLIAERKEDLKSNDDKVRHRAEMTLKNYLKFLENEGLSPNGRRVYFTGIRNFYQRNYCELTFFRRDGPKVITVTEGSKAASKEDLRTMINVSTPREKALILFIKDTGLSESDVAKLKLKDLVQDVSGIFEVESPITIVTNRKKTGTRTITFLGEEGLEAVKTMLRIRQQGSPELKIRRYGREENKGGIEPETLTLESPLFRSYGKFMKTLKEPQIKHLSPHAVSVIVRKVAIKSGIWKTGFSAHALRRFFQTSLESAGLNRNWIKSMMGHRLEGVESSYSKPEIAMLKEAYLKAYSHLAISETIEQRTRVEMLETQVEDLILNGKRKEERLKEQDTILTELLEMKKALAILPKILEKAKTEKEKAELVDVLKKMLKEQA